MTENEKLRELLAEARKVLAYPFVTVHHRELNDRIDSALAEPVQSDPPKPPEWACYNCGSMGDFSPIQYAAGDYDIECDNCGSKNTDEAGNVVRRLVLDLDEARAERDEARGEAARWREEGEGLLRYACEASAAYQLGAEAMREAAAINCAGQVCAAQIRALPLPEDKP